MKISREVKASFLVIASILLFIWGYTFLKGKDLFVNYKTYYVTYDNVEGLAKSAPVTLNGLTIGKVNDIKIDTQSAKLIVEIQITTDFPISSSSSAVIYEPGLIGGRQIAIEPDFSNTILAKNGQYFNGKVKLSLTSSIQEKLVPIQEKFEKLMIDIDVLLSGVNNILDKNSQENIKMSISELSKTMKELRATSSSANAIVNDNKTDLKVIISNFKKASTDFAKISDSLNRADLGNSVKNLNKTLAKVDGLLLDLQSGKGSAGKLLKDESLYLNLKSATKEMELLLKDVRLYPTRYINVSVFGKKNKPYIESSKDSISQIKK